MACGLQKTHIFRKDTTTIIAVTACFCQTGFGSIRLRLLLTALIR